MNFKIGILGGTGLIGKEWILSGIREGHRFRVFTRQENPPKELQGFPEIQFVTCTLPSTQDLEGLDVVINLVGEPIAGVRWTEERKKIIRTSRVDYSKGLIARLLETKKPPSVYMQASAVGYYGMSESYHEAYSESQTPGSDLLASLCVDWENQTHTLESKNIRTILLRTGIILSLHGGALEKMIPPFQMGVGGAIASGNQGMSWIHILDFIQASMYLIKNPEAKGAFNLVSPEPVSNAMFCTHLAKVLNRPNLFKVPEFVIQALYGDGSVVITKGQYVIPTKLLNLGYEFQFQNLNLALRNLLGKN
ncbi:TIGR01777 family oxidoreductase [Leptospira sp. 96542]|nr:TIGR01777 family oxidoreductase [Leptospira sp. 96542]